MEGEAQIPDPALRLQLLQALYHAQLLHPGKELAIHGMHQVEIDIFGLQSGKLLVEQSVHIL